MLNTYCAYNYHQWEREIYRTRSAGGGNKASGSQKIHAKIQAVKNCHQILKEWLFSAFFIFHKVMWVSTTQRFSEGQFLQCLEIESITYKRSLDF